MNEWQNRPVDSVYAVVFIDVLYVKVRDGQVSNRPIYVAMGVTLGGERDVLGVWAGDGSEGSKQWGSYLTELKNRGLDDVVAVLLTDFWHCGKDHPAGRFSKNWGWLVEKIASLSWAQNLPASDYRWMVS